MSARKKADEPAARERLLEAAVSLFAERGYAATGTSAICERAGVAKTALYWHFGNKEGLLAEVIEHVETSWIEAVQKRVYLEAGIEQRIDALLTGWLEMTQASPHLWRLPIVANLEQADHSERVREALTRVWRRAEDALAQGIEDSIGTALPGLDMVAHTVISLFQSALLKQISQPDPVRLQREMDELRRTLQLLVWIRLPYETQQAIHAMGPPEVPTDQKDG